VFLTTGIFGNFEGWRGEFFTFKTGILAAASMINKSGSLTPTDASWIHRSTKTTKKCTESMQFVIITFSLFHFLGHYWRHFNATRSVGLTNVRSYIGYQAFQFHLVKLLPCRN